MKLIPLADHDLCQMSEESVSSLIPVQRDVLLARALAGLRKARDRLNQSPTNSSKLPLNRAPRESTAVETPPSAAPTAADADVPKPSDATGPAPALKASSGKADVRKAGKQFGAKGFGRTQKLVQHHAVGYGAGNCRADA